MANASNNSIFQGLSSETAIAIGDFTLRALAPTAPDPLASAKAPSPTTILLLQVLGHVAWDYSLAMVPSVDSLLAGVSNATATEGIQLQRYLQKLHQGNPAFAQAVDPLLLVFREGNALAEGSAEGSSEGSSEGRAEGSSEGSLDSNTNSSAAFLADTRPETVRTLEAVAVHYVHELRDRLEDAETLYRQALRLQFHLGGTDAPASISLLNQWAMLYDLTGRLRRARPLYHRVLRECERQLGLQHATLAPHLQNLAFVYFCLGQYNKAKPLYERLVQLHAQVLGPEAVATYDSQLRLAQLHRFAGENETAEQLGLAILDRCQHQLKPDDPMVLATLRFLTGPYEDAGQPEKAEAIYKALLEIYKRQPDGGDVGFVTETLHRLGRLYQTLERFGEAEQQFQIALDLKERKLGQVHPAIPSTLMYLAGLYRQTQQYDEAEPLYLVAVAILQETQGPGHEDVALVLTYLAQLYWDMGREGDAQAAERQAADLYALG
jgi:tetratricopeptide (TPR) repeat protein